MLKFTSSVLAVLLLALSAQVSHSELRGYRELEEDVEMMVTIEDDMNMTYSNFTDIEELDEAVEAEEAPAEEAVEAEEAPAEDAPTDAPGDDDDDEDDGAEEPERMEDPWAEITSGCQCAGDDELFCGAGSDEALELCECEDGSIMCSEEEEIPPTEAPVYVKTDGD